MREIFFIIVQYPNIDLLYYYCFIPTHYFFYCYTIWNIFQIYLLYPFYMLILHYVKILVNS